MEDCPLRFSYVCAWCVWDYTVTNTLTHLCSPQLPWIPSFCSRDCWFSPPSMAGRVLPISLEHIFSAWHPAAPWRPCLERIGNVITTVFISKRTAGALLLSIWTDPSGYSWNSLLRKQPYLKLLVQLPLNLAFLLQWLLTHFSLGGRGLPYFVWGSCAPVAGQWWAREDLVTYPGYPGGQLSLICPVLNCPIIWSQQ